MSKTDSSATKTIKLTMEFKDTDFIDGVLGFVKKTKYTKSLFEFGDYGAIEFEIDESAQIVDARFIPVG